MWGPKLCLLLLLGTQALAQQDIGNVEDQSPVCFLARRYKNFRRYVYDYEAETFNGVTGASDNKSGPKVSCKVEIDVPQTCSFIIRTTECSLSEIFDVDAEGKPVYQLAAEAQAFTAAMEKNALKVTVQGQTEVKLYPEDDEPVNILNIKRGIVSALIVPVMEEDTNKAMPTVHGVCPTDFTVNFRDDIPTDVTVDRDLSKCDWFFARRQTTSPLALISGMNYPLSKMISSTQTCNYQFDNQKKHMTEAVCIEKHIFLPLSYKNEYGISALVKQSLKLVDATKINDRIFDRNENNEKNLYLDVADDKSPVQTKDAVIATMETLNSLSQTNEGEQRAGLFHKLVSELRVLEADVLTSFTEEMMDISHPLTYQALVQCGSPACTSALLKILRTFDEAALEVDAIIYALALLPNPSRLMVKDMLSMAQYKQSKPIMYALSNAVRKLHVAEGVTPEITAVSEFMASLLGADCAGEKEMTFLTLRVVGNMGAAMEDADPAIKTTLLKCMRQPATTLSVQLAAIQAFRRMSVTEEVRSNLQRVSQYPKGAVQKRLAAYLMLMRNPQDSDIEMVKKLLTQEQNVQIKSFVTSHIYNIIFSKSSENEEIAKKIVDALQDTGIVAHSDFTTMSRNYKLGMSNKNMGANVQGNIIFDPSSQLPREVLLETTMEVFGFNVDIWEFGMEGKGLEPTIDALFGKNGFFPDTMSKALYWAEDKMPPQIKEVLEKWVAPLKSEGKRVPDNLMREIVRNVNKLVKDLQNQDSTEAMAYLKLMGAELGYIKSSDLKSIADNALMYSDILMRMIPKELLTNLVSKTDNEMFAHYIFMDNKFILPTGSGMPLKFALTGTFAPGAKGGLRFSRQMNELVFMPSVGVEFRTQMGVHIPEFVVSGIEMQTSLYHESALNAKVTMAQNQIKLSIPTPQSTTKLLRIGNKVTIVGSGFTTVVPHQVGDASCGSLFAGVRYCTKTLRGDAGDNTDVPYFPLTGETSYAFDIKPSKEVSEYTATIAYELLAEGDAQDQMVDSLKMILKAEGNMPTEATATLKFNRDMKVLTTEVQVPDLDIEAGVKLGLSDTSADDKSLVLEITNKNVPQMSLIGRAKLNQASAGGMVQAQLLVPSLSTDATVTTVLTTAEGLALEIKSDLKISDLSSVQAVVFKYGDEQAEVQLLSNTNADTKIPLQYAEALRDWTVVFMDDVMNQQVPNTDMTLDLIVKKGVEANRIWIRKFSDQFPYAEAFYNNVMTELAKNELPSVPENLFMNFDSTFKYKFNGERLAITVPLPLGGKSSEELRVPAVVTLPYINVPQLGVEIAPLEIQVPAFTVPSEYDLSLPLMGMLEVSAKVNSNYYNWDASASVGNMTVDSPNYQAKFNIIAESPIELLSFSVEGSTSVTDTAEEKMELTLDSSLKHKMLNSGFSVLETLTLTDNVLMTGRYNVYAASPIGLDTSLTITTQFTLDSNTIFGDLNTDGSVTLGSVTAATTYLHTFSVEPIKKEAKLESALNIKSDILNIVNKVKGSYENEELFLESNTNLNSGPIRHTTKLTLSYKDVKLAIQSDSVTKAFERMARSQLEFSASEGQASLRIENQAGGDENRAYSLLTGSLNPSGLEINADASINLFSSLASHKATLALNAEGLTTTCTTTARHTPLTFENVFHGGLGTSGATMSLTTKGGIHDNKAELSVEGKIASTEVALNSVFEGNLFDINGRNRINLKLNEDGLALSHNLVGSFKEIRTENTHSLSMTLSSISLNSKTDNFLNERNSYVHNIKIDVERFTALVSVKNDLKVMEISFVNDAKFKAEPYNMELSGTMMGVFSEEELKNTYELKFVDMILSANWNTNGKLLGAHMTHTTSMEVAGLTMKFDNVANFKSKSLRLDSTVKTLAEPFMLHIDAIFNSDGEVYLYGEQSGELYSKFLLKAEPLLFTQSFEYRASTTHTPENRPTIKTMMESKFNSILSVPEQGLTLKMTSKVNENTLDQEISAYNNAERMGIELAGAFSAPIFSESKEDYAISAFVKYDKNSDSHFIQIPFIEFLPEVIEEMKLAAARLIEMLGDIDSEYEISERLQAKVGELKEIIANFDFNVFMEDFRRFLRSAESFISDLTDKIPTEEVIDMLNTIRETIMSWINKYGIANKFNAIYTKIEDVLSSYEIEKIISAIMDEIVKIMRQYQVREKVQHVFRSLQSIDIQPLLNKVMAPAQELLNELSSINIDQLIEDISDFYMRMIQQIQSFDYNTFIVELKDKVAEMTKIPCFGKLYGEFRVASPHYKLSTTADLENTTTTTITPEFKMNFKSQAESTLKILDFNVDASAQFSAPERSQLNFAETIKVDQAIVTLDHKGEMTIYGLTRAEGSANTFAKVSSEVYTAELTNSAELQVEDKLSATVETSYKHKLDVPRLSVFSEATLNHKTVLLLEDFVLKLNVNNVATEKYVVQEFSDEAKHVSDLQMVMDIHTMKLTFTGETSASSFKMIQNVIADIDILRDFKINAKFETETPFLKVSVAEVKFITDAGDLKIEFTASHRAELVGPVDGSISNSLTASATPSEVIFDTKNKGNAKISLPFKLSGKVDLQNDIAFTLNSEVHQASWTGLARFNQQKYSHFFSFSNNETEINGVSQINAEANLDILKERISLPVIELPLLEGGMPRMEEFSVWEQTPLGDILTTTKQAFDLNSNFKYVKNPEVITFDIDLEPIANAINSNIKTVHKRFHINKDKVADFLATSFAEAMVEYEKYSVEFPTTDGFDSFKVPVINMDVSSFTFPMPHRTMISAPSMYVPSALTKLTLPKVTLPKNVNVRIPTLGDLSYEFSMKTPIITLKTDASILNEDSIKIKFDASSSSESELLVAKIEGSSIVNMDDGLKMTSDLSLTNVLLEATHESTINFGLNNLETSITNTLMSNEIRPLRKVQQELTINAEDGLVVSMSSLPVGRIALQMQTKRPAQVKARLYGYYPSEPTTPIDILGMKMSVMDSKTLNIQTTWNMEIPNELMLTVKDNVPYVIQTVSDFAEGMYRLNKGIARMIVRRSQFWFRKTVDYFAELDLFDMMDTVLVENVIPFLNAYKTKVEVVLDAVVRFLRETRFQIPGYQQRMSGLEIYEMLSGFVADVTEEAVQKIPEYFISTFAAVLDYFQSIEFTLPGSDYIVSGREIIDDLSSVLSTIQNQIIVLVRNLGSITLEDIFQKFPEFVQFVIDQSQRLVDILKSENVERFSTFVSDVYRDARNSKVVSDVVTMIEEAYKAILEYIDTLNAKVNSIKSNVPIAQLKADVQTWVDTMIKRINAFQNNVMRTLKEKTNAIEHYVRVGDREVEIDIPLPVVARFA